MPGKSAQIEGLSSTPLTASRAPTKTRWRPVKANHRVSGLVQHTCALLGKANPGKVRGFSPAKFKSAPNKIGLQAAPMLDIRLGAYDLTGQQ
jgi:hypothetical protein